MVLPNFEILENPYYHEVRAKAIARGDGGVPDKDWGLRAQGVQGFGVRVKSLKFWV